MKYEYMPKEAAPLLCPNPNVPAPSNQGGSFSIWGYMTAAVVASTVAANIVNNVNSNNNNNNNNNNEDNQNNNNYNMNLDENSNMNMNMIMPGGRSLPWSGLGKRLKTECIKMTLCLSSPKSDRGSVEVALRRIVSLMAGFSLVDLFGDDTLSFGDVVSSVLAGPHQNCQNIDCPLLFSHIE
jgi:hypothetical protein